MDTGTTEPSELLTSIGDGADAASRAKIGKGKLKGFKTVEAVWAYPNGYNDPPPMKWSALWYGFEPGGRIDVEEATQA